MDRGRIWGMLRGREAHVMPEPDGSLRPPVWLDGLPTQRAMVQARVPAILDGPGAHGRWRRGGPGGPPPPAPPPGGRRLHRAQPRGARQIGAVAGYVDTG